MNETLDDWALFVDRLNTASKVAPSLVNSLMERAGFLQDDESLELCIYLLGHYQTQINLKQQSDIENDRALRG